MSLGKAFGIVDQELLKFELETTQRGLRKKTEETIVEFLQDYLKTSDDYPFETNAAFFNLSIALSRHLHGRAETVFSIYTGALERQKGRKTQKVLSAIYRKAILPEMKKEKKWCEEVVLRHAKVKGIPGGLLANALAHSKKIQASDLRKSVSGGIQKSRKRPSGLKLKSKQPRRKATSESTEAALRPEKWRQMTSMTQKQAARLLYVTERTIRNLCRKGTLNRTRSGRVCRDEKFEAENDRRNNPAQK